jgi:hypothetical protein
VKEPIRRRIQEKLDPELAKPKPSAQKKAAVVPSYFDRTTCEEDVLSGRVYTFKDIAGMLRCHRATAGKIFKDEPGIIQFGTEYRVPHAVLERVVRRMMKRR